METNPNTATQPMVSVIIATYNRAKTLGRAIESVFSQSYPVKEIIIIDDGSTDNTKEVASGYAKKFGNITYIYQENAHCHVKTRNNGITRARGKYLAILDDDDFWCDNDKLKKQVEFLEKNIDHVLVGGGAIKIDENGEEIIRYLLPERDEDIRSQLLVSNSFAHVTMMFRKDAFDKLGGYDEEFDGMEDWNLWLRMGTVGKFHNIPDFFVRYTGHRKENPGYVEKKYGRFKWFTMNIALQKKFKNYYPHFTRAVALSCLRGAYSFMPLRRNFWLITLKLRGLLGKTPYTYGKKN